LPSDYVSRLVDELADHVADFFRENPSMDANSNLDGVLGTPDHIAATAKTEFRRRTFAGRHPAATFLAGPPIAVLLALAANVALIVGVLMGVDYATDGAFEANDAEHLPPSPFEMSVVRTLCGTTRFAPFIASAWLLALAARRAGLWKWGALACGIVAAIAFCFTSVVGQSPAEGMGYWSHGFGWKPGLDPLLQAAVPVGFAFWLLRKSSTTAPSSVVAT
jgi:hypothetical protein